MNSLKRFSLGSEELGEQVAQRARRTVPAYRHFLKKHGLEFEEKFKRLPQSDKESYILSSPFEDLLGDDTQEIWGINSSSGSSGGLFYWPQLKVDVRRAPAGMRQLMEETLAIHQKRTMAIVGLSLGGWFGGDYFSWVLKTMALLVPYSFCVFSPGKDLNTIIEIICTMHSLVDQIVLFIVPSAIAHLHLKASELKQPLPIEKLKYVVTGEFFPESLRASLHLQAGLEPSTPFMFSFYGSADSGALGIETLASIALRKLLCQNQALASMLELDASVPHFFHFFDQ